MLDACWNVIINHANKPLEYLMRSSSVFRMKGCFLLCTVFDTLTCFHDLFCCPPTRALTFQCVMVVIHCLSSSGSPWHARISSAGMSKVQGPCPPGLPSSHLREPADVPSQLYMYVALWGTGHVPGLEAGGDKGIGRRTEQNSWRGVQGYTREDVMKTWRCQFGITAKWGDRPDRRDPCCFTVSAMGISYWRILGREVIWSHFVSETAYGEQQQDKQWVSKGGCCSRPGERRGYNPESASSWCGEKGDIWAIYRKRY